MKKKDTLIGDMGIINKTDSFGIIVIIVCSIITVALIVLGFLALTT